MIGPDQAACRFELNIDRFRIAKSGNFALHLPIVPPILPIQGRARHSREPLQRSSSIQGPQIEDALSVLVFS